MSPFNYPLILFIIISGSSASPEGSALDWSQLLGSALNGGPNSQDVDWASLIAAAASASGGGAGEGIGGDWGHILGALLGGGGHRHSDNPDEEDHVGHQQHSAATFLFTSWLQSLWSQMPEEWIRPIEDLMKMFGEGGANGLKGEALFNSLENPQFRRKWIRALSGLTANWVKHFTQPKVQQSWARSLASYSGVNWDPKQSAEDNIPFIIDKAVNNQFGLNIKTSPYLKPALRYIMDLLMVGEGKVSGMSAKEIDDRLAEGLNSEVIETSLRVWRSYKFSIYKPSCDRKILCEINSPDHFANSNSTLKPAITKLASLVSAWFLSGHTGTPFLELYIASTENYNCHEKYQVDCSDFHEEDIRVSTEYYHNEL